MTTAKPTQPLPLTGLLLGLSLLLAAGCSPRVEVAVPQDPITINLNVKIEHEIQVKVDREIDELFDEKSELF